MIDSWEVGLRELLEDKQSTLHLLGVGSPLRMDDSVGLYIISGLTRKLGRRPRRNVFLHPASLTPERVLSKFNCAREKVLVFDAVEANRPPGTVVFAGMDHSKFGYFATHNVPLKLLPNVVANPSNVYVAGVEPRSLDVGEEMSEEVRASADRISVVVLSSLGGGADGPA